MLKSRCAIVGRSPIELVITRPDLWAEGSAVAVDPAKETADPSVVY
jgi:hypothetical protein